MQHKCKVTVIDKKCFNDYQEKYLADPKSGPCPFYNVGDEFIFERYGGDDTFWRTGNGTQCGEAWDCISMAGGDASVLMAHSAAKRGTASAVIFTLRFRAAALCAAGLTTSA